MHGRLKVKTSVEQQEAKRKEREKKLKLYTAGTEKVFQKRQDGVYDKEGLDVSGELLAANPDFYTLWNFRREVFLHLNEQPEAELQSLYESELGFLEACLRVNPKSYGTWHHRGWVMDHMPRPDWHRELKLCNTCLELDERNFHCWDYRRFVVKQANVAHEEEFKYTTDKISSNFSNFSSWHYRSQLLPKLYPDAAHPVGINENILLQEYEMTQNAFFTDPNDQSAWFYHRWLLGRGDIWYTAKGMVVGQKPFNIRLLYISRLKPMVMVSLTKIVKVGKDCELILKVDGSILTVDWYAPSHHDYSNVWLCKLDPAMVSEDVEHDIQVVLRTANGHKSHDDDKWNCVLCKDNDETKHTSNFKPGMLFSSGLSTCTSSTLREQLEQCQQLHDLEPDNKWALLTIVALMRALDPLAHEVDTFCYLEKLREIDPMRANYYKDLRSKYVIENAIESSPKGGAKEIMLRQRQLSVLYHLDHMVMVTKLDLSQNQLSSLRGCEVLQCLKSLNVDDNQISSCDGILCLDRLEELFLRNNCIRNVEGLSCLSSCPKLRVLYLHGNPLCDSPELLNHVHEILPQVSIVS